MKNRILKLLAVVSFVVSVVITNLAPLTVLAAADTCTWTGTTSANWATGTNWTGCDNGGVPENGDTLVFPSSASNKTTNNNISNLSVATVTINGTGYVLTGNDFTITGVTAITANETAQISANVTYNSGSNVNIYPLAGKTLTLSGTSALSLSTIYELNVGSSSFTGTVNFNGNITGSAASQFIVQNGARVNVAGSTNTFTATTVGAESDGIFECNSATCFGNSANNIYMGGGVVDILVTATYSNGYVTSTTTPNTSKITAVDNVTITGTGTVNDNLDIQQKTAARSLQFTGAGTLNGSIGVYGNNTSSNVKFDGGLSGAGGITVNSGNAWMSAGHTFTGTVTVKSGAVAIADQANSLGATSSPTIIEDGGTLMLDSPSPTTSAEPIQIAGDGISPTNYKGAIYVASTSDNFILTGSITLNADSTVYNEAEGVDLELSGVISGTANLSLVSLWDSFNSGSIEVTGASPNTYVGDTNVTGGTIYFEKTGAVPGNLTIDNSDDTGSSNRSNVYFYDSSDVMADTGVLTMGADEYSSITFGANNEVIGGLHGDNGSISIQDDGDTLVINQDFDSTYSGTFYMDGNHATIEKRGSGNLTLNGDSQFVGDQITFVVTEGTLSINGNVRTTNGGDVEVNGGTFKGVGTVGNLTTTGGTLAPGNSPGSLAVSSLTLDATNTLEVELNGSVAGTSYDQIVASGAVDLGSATLSVKLGFTPTVGQVFTIITGSPVAGTFKNLPNGSTIVVDGSAFRVNYNGTNVTLTYLGGAQAAALADTGTNTVMIALSSILLISFAVILLSHRRALLSPKN